ncbi:MAG: hypothetical protein LHW61_02370 [Candidatus Cloacimonetes bacterium]|nr:hypothetical protein [Candidatus Cloacimonadota bacterium]
MRVENSIHSNEQNVVLRDDGDDVRNSIYYDVFHPYNNLHPNRSDGNEGSNSNNDEEHYGCNNGAGESSNLP